MKRRIEKERVGKGRGRGKEGRNIAEGYAMRIKGSRPNSSGIKRKRGRSVGKRRTERSRRKEFRAAGETRVDE